MFPILLKDEDLFGIRFFKEYGILMSMTYEPLQAWFSADQVNLSNRQIPYGKLRRKNYSTLLLLL